MTDECHFEEMLFGTTEESMMLEMLNRLTEIDRDQSQVSMELTRLIVERATDHQLKEKDILTTFKKAKQMVSSCSPLQELWQKMSS